MNSSGSLENPDLVKPHVTVSILYSGKPAEQLESFKKNSEEHPWMGWDRYRKAEEMLKEAEDDFDVKDCFEILKAVSQTVCPTVVSMVYDLSEKKICWCENRCWDQIQCRSFSDTAER